METDTIGGLARAGGVGVETVRYYQRRGLLRTPARGDGVRRYGPEDARRLRFIRSAQAAGFTLEQITELLALDSGRDHARARELARGRIRDQDTRIADLTAARAALSRLADACDQADALARSSRRSTRPDPSPPHLSGWGGGAGAIQRP